MDREGRRPLIHFDFYRVERGEEILDVGWDEFLEEGALCAVEWAGRFPGLMPAGALRLQITTSAEGRRRVELRRKADGGAES